MAFGNTRPRARAIVRGLAERGVPGTAFDPSTGTGHVAFKAGDYGRAAARGVRVMELLVETFGGLGDGLMELLEEAAGARGDKLSAAEYDETTWSARRWMVFVRAAAHLRGDAEGGGERDRAGARSRDGCRSTRSG